MNEWVLVAMVIAPVAMAAIFVGGMVVQGRIVAAAFARGLEAGARLQGRETELFVDDIPEMTQAETE